MSNSTVALALITLLLYIALALACCYFLWKYREIQTTPELVGYYDEPKMLFFLVLMVAAVLDAPMFITCAARGGPAECEWGPRPQRGEDAGYAVCWCLHLLASCGYVYAILTPPVLWNDIIAPTCSGTGGSVVSNTAGYRDGLLFYSATAVDSTKIYFRCAFVLYCAVQMISVVTEIVAAGSHGKLTTSSNSANAVGNCLEAVLIAAITAGCLWCAMRLQQYVMRVKLGTSAERKVLAQLNYTLAIIVVSYLLRAVLVLSLFDGIPQFIYWVPSSAGSYAVWLLGTRWLPNIFCSFCLLPSMRFSAMKSSGAAAAAASAVSSTAGGGDNKRPLLEFDEEEDDAEHLPLPHSVSDSSFASRASSRRCNSFGFFSEHRREFFTDNGDYFRRVQQNSVDFTSVLSKSAAAEPAEVDAAEA